MSDSDSILDLAAALRSAVPYSDHLGIEYEEVTPGRAVLRLPDRKELHNHFGGPHAGALFSLAETASGAVVVASFADQLGRATPLAAAAEIVYRALAMGEVTAEATLERPRDEVVAELDEGGRPQFPVKVAVRDAAGTVTAEVVVRWALRPNG